MHERLPGPLLSSPLFLFEEAKELIWKIEVSVKTDKDDPAGRKTHRDLLAQGYSEVDDVKVTEVYLLDGDLSEEDVLSIAKRLLADPVVHEFKLTSEEQESAPASSSPGSHVLEVYGRPGVMDPFEMNIRRAVGEMGFEPRSIRTARQYTMRGELSKDRLLEIGNRVLANPVIQEIEVGKRPPRPETKVATPGRERVEIPVLKADDAALQKISLDRRLALSLPEMQTIKTHFTALSRNPTDIEIEMLAQTWSEHCIHKTLSGPIDFMGEKFSNLLGETIMKSTRDLNLPWCLSVFKDNAGVIALTDDQAVCFKVETHNHPSAIEPYGGAGTGIGGVIRDILGTGMAARPVLNTDVFCFAPPDTRPEDLPPGTLPPLQIMKGVVSGVRDYGNRMGIPTASGAIHFDERYVGNPLVYCGTVGILPCNRVEKAAHPGDAIVVVGGRTGRDGLGGATFSSYELSEESEVVSSGAVQIGNPIEEKRTLDVILQARDRDLFSCITDCGAGGLSSAVGEMGEGLGVELELNRVPLKYAGLSSVEIWLSEAQERMVLAVPEDKVEALAELILSEDVEMTVLGSFTDTGRVHLTHDGETVLDLDLEFLHDGLPRVEKKAEWNPSPAAPLTIPSPAPDAGSILKTILSHPTVASKEWVIRQYDHEVQGASVIKPLVGEEEDGPSDASVIAPILGSTIGVAVGNGLNPDYGDLDPYRMSAAAIDEALRNVTAVGADPERIALLDNFSWGSADRPQALGALVLASKACGDYATAFRTPFISGKDSLNNEYRVGDKIISIPHTLLISSIGVVPDVRKCVTMDLKGIGHHLYIAGFTRPELGGSQYAKALGITGGEVPQVDAEIAKKTFIAVHRAIQAGLIRACHDLSEGGLAVSLAEAAFAGNVGATIHLGQVPVKGFSQEPSPHEILFSESCSRFLIEVQPDLSSAFEQVFEGLPLAKLGETSLEPFVQILAPGNETILREPLIDLKEAWQATLRFS